MNHNHLRVLKKTIFSFLFILVATVAQATAFSTIKSDSETTGSTLVRFYQPIKTTQEVKKWIPELNLNSLQIISKKEGLVSIKNLSTQKKRMLLKNKLVQSITPDLTYHLALNLDSIEEPAPQYAQKPLFQPFHLNMYDYPYSGVPRVLPAPTSVQKGADPYTLLDWAILTLHLPQLGKNILNSHHTIVALIDTGVDYNHEDLKGAMWRDPKSHSFVGWDFANNLPRPFDQVKFDIQGCLKDLACRTGKNRSKYLVNPGHGTHCAGHIAAVANNSIGMQGVAPGVKIMALKVFYDRGKLAGKTSTKLLVQSIDFAIKNKAKIISASWGALRPKVRDFKKDELYQAIKRAKKAGILFVTAAGNRGINLDKATYIDWHTGKTIRLGQYPAMYPLDNIISVAAIDYRGARAKFSNYGKNSIDLAAAGAKVFSTVPGNKYQHIIARWKTKKGTYRTIYWNGTSMSTPLVAGAAALIWSQHPKENYLEIKERILKSARKLPWLKKSLRTGGILDVSAALSYVPKKVLP